MLGALKAVRLPPIDYGDPIQETTYFDEELGATVTELMYFVPDSISTYSDDSGSGWFKNQKIIDWAGYSTPSTTYYAQGYFTWGDGDVSVSYPSGGCEDIPSNWYLSPKEEVTTGTGKYAGFLHKYAYVNYLSYLVEYDNVYQGSNAKKLDVTVRISQSGNAI